MKTQFTVITERIDDVVLLLHVDEADGIARTAQPASATSLEAGRLGLGLGGGYLACLYPLRRRPPQSCGTRMG